MIPISIHAPARGATKLPFRLHCTDPDFNPRSREGSDVVSYKIESVGREFQSTLPRGERLEEINKFVETDDISIHAPARGATTRGLKCQPPPGFQSTLPRGERRNWMRDLFRTLTISIHAPARGATSAALPSRTAQANFNPRSREGSDHRRPYTHPG